MNEENKVSGIAQDGGGDAWEASGIPGEPKSESVEKPGATAHAAPVKSGPFSSPSSAGIRGLIGRDSQSFTPEQKLLLLDVWEKSTLTGTDFSSIVGVEPATLYLWRKLYQKYGPEALFPKPKGGKKGMKVDSITRRAIVLLTTPARPWGAPSRLPASSSIWPYHDAIRPRLRPMR